MSHFRACIFIAIAALVFCCCESRKTESVPGKLVEVVAPLYDSALKPFYHGVASGDPLADRVIIWTRVTPDDSLENIPAQWELSENDKFSPVLKSGTTSTSAARDYTIKVDVSGLAPATYYYYRFKALDHTSPIGRTKTIPQSNLDSLKFAVVSCSNWEFGYFNAYSRIAEREVDAVLHLGDYIYEYAEGRYGNKKVDRKNLPDHEIVSLQDYRTRYSQYHTDKGLRDMRMRHPLIAIWDDHEVANNVYVSGAQNHQPDKEGDFETRKKAAKQAYYEWIPIRESDKHYRSFSFGNLASVIMLDERLEGRTKQLDSASDPAFNQNDHAILGAEQLQWFESELKSSPAVWKVIGNQVIYSDVDQSLISPKNPKNLDSWDGYPAEKQNITSFILQNKVKDIVFLSGDSHASWAFEVAVDPTKTYNKSTSKGAFAVEFGVTSISSANSNEYTSDDTVKMEEANLLKANPHLKYTNHRDHGYLLLTLFPTKARGEWYFIETLLLPDNGEHLGKRLEVEKGTNKLK
jgi:alkaline phosphatase D